MAEQQQSKAGELVGLQILRAIAAILVAFHHTLEASLLARVGPRSPDWLTTFGASGVDIFFVISGFIMIFVCFRNERSAPEAGSFLFRRFTRIYPLYWLCCLALLSLSAINLLRSEPDPSDIISALILLPTSTRIMGISWTLTFEIYFYLLFAATLFYNSALRSTIFTISLILIAHAMGYLMPSGAYGVFLTDPIVFEFCAGILLGYCYLRGWKVAYLPVIMGVVGAVLLVAAPIFVEHPNTGGLVGWPRLLTWGVGSLLVVASFLYIQSRGGAQKVLVVLGDASYAIYLTHFFVIGVYARFLRSSFLSDLPQPVIVVVVTAICAVVGLITHYLIERPLLEMIRNRVAKRQLAKLSS